MTEGTVPSLSWALPRLDVPCDPLKTTQIPFFGAGRSPWHTLDRTVRPVGHTLSLSGCRGQCGPGRKFPGTFPFPARLPSSDVSLFPLARPELWIHSSPAQFWANLSLPHLCPHLLFATKGVLVSPNPRHHPVQSVPSTASPPASPWAVHLGGLGSSIPLPVSAHPAGR